MKSKSIINPLSSFGGRVFYCRAKTGKSKNYYYLNYGIHKNIILKYELSGVAPKKTTYVEKLFNAFTKEKIEDLTLEWLLYGNGKAPKLDTFKRITKVKIDEDPDYLKMDLQNFMKLYKNSIIRMVMTHEFEPFISYGDYIGGILYQPEKCQTMENELCLIKYKNTENYLPKRVFKYENGCFLVKNDLNTSTESIPSSKLEEIAPIILIRFSKKFSFSK